IVGTAIDAAKTVESPAFTLSIVSSQGFDLAVLGAPYRLKPGGTTPVRVTATRRGYDGPITVALRGLPAGVSAPLSTIPPATTTVDIPLSADANAAKGDKPNVLAVGTATDLPGKELAAPPFLVGVLGISSFDLSTDPGPIVLRRGGAARVKV